MIKGMSNDAVSRPGREGLLAVATRLFAEQGFAATSLQQIADAAHVTKAAVYHHYRTKDEILTAVLSPAVETLASIVRTAAVHRAAAARAEAALVGLADQAVVNRHLWSVLLSDPTFAHVVRTSAEHHQTFEDLRELLAGPDADQRRRLAVSLFLSGLMGPALDPSCNDIDDDTLRLGIVDAGRRLLTV